MHASPIADSNTMRLEHVALWVRDLDAMKTFYCRYFNASAGDRYHNPRTGFSSYFLLFENGARLELMHRGEAANDSQAEPGPLGLHHLAIGTGLAARVDDLTTELAEAGCPVVSGPRLTGDGYYESVVLDPEGNRLEITI